MSNDDIDVRHIANLARINISDEECVTFEAQLRSVLGYIETLKEANVEGVDLTSDVTQFTENLREDLSQQGITQEAFIQNSPESGLGQVRVPKVVDA